MKISIITFCFWCALAIGHAQDVVTADQFRQIAATPADAAPLPLQITSAGPMWTNATATVLMRYQSGRVYTDNMKVTAKSVGGKYRVFTAQSQIYKTPVNSIVMYDDKAKALKTLGLEGDTVTVATSVVDYDKKIYAETSSYGEGFTEITAGTYSMNMDSEQTAVFKNGVLYMTREVKTQH